MGEKAPPLTAGSGSATLWVLRRLLVRLRTGDFLSPPLIALEVFASAGI